MAKVKIAVLASGRGSNFKAIIDAIKAGECNAEIKVLITDNPKAKAMDYAHNNDIPVGIVERKQFKNRDGMDDTIKDMLDNYEVDLVVLAGYMRIIRGKKLLHDYKNKIINIHPALLPSFTGADAQKQAFDHGVKISGLTIHFVDESLDGGPIIYQEAIDISDCKTGNVVADKIIKHEHKAYPMVIDSFSKGRYEFIGRRTRYKKG